MLPCVAFRRALLYFAHSPLSFLRRVNQTARRILPFVARDCLDAIANTTRAFEFRCAIAPRVGGEVALVPLPLCVWVSVQIRRAMAFRFARRAVAVRFQRGQRRRVRVHGVAIPIPAARFLQDRLQQCDFGWRQIA